MTFYGEVAFKWSAKDTVKPISAAALQMNGISHTFQSNVVSKRPNIRWSTAKWVTDGKVLISPQDQLPWFHSHRSYFKAMWAFDASAEDLGLTLDLLHKVDDYEGHLDKYDLVWTPDGEDATQALMDRINNSTAGMDALRCWLVGSDEEKILEYVNGTDSSSLYPESWQQNWKESWYDRAGEVHCKDSWTFEKGDSYTVVTLNGVDDRLMDKMDTFTMFQHAILFLAYETPEGSELGPTMEVYGDFSTEHPVNGGFMDLKLKTTWFPEYLQKKRDFLGKVDLREKDFERYFDIDLDIQDTTVIRIGYNLTIDRTLKNPHTLYDKAKEKLANITL